MKPVHRSTLAALILLAASTLLFAACSHENLLGPQEIDDEFFDKSVEIIRQIGDTPPNELATISLGDASLEFWPYTGTTFDGTSQQLTLNVGWSF